MEIRLKKKRIMTFAQIIFFIALSVWFVYPLQKMGLFTLGMIWNFT